MVYTIRIMELILDIEDAKIDTIIKNLEEGRKHRPLDYKKNITHYWGHHLSKISIERVGEGKIRVMGESGFYFPGMTYYGADYINTIYKRFGLMRTIDGSQFDLTIPQHKNKFGYKIKGKWISIDFLRSIYSARKIITESERKGEKIPESSRILEIGSGTGIQALVFKLLFKDSTYFLVDFPETLALASVFLNLVLPDCKILYFNEWMERPDLLASNEYDFVLIPNYAMAYVPRNSIHLALNTVSMQEMNYETINMYFKELRRVLTAPSLFYQSNRDKMMEGILIEISKYPYNENDTHIYKGVDEFLKRTIVIRKCFGRFPFLRKIRVPILKKGAQIQFLTKLSAE